jgi:hypothetical protein
MGHLGRNIRQTTHSRALLGKSASRAAESHDVGGECAVYMMAEAAERPAKPAFPAVPGEPCGPKTLTPHRSPPIRPRFLKWT